MKSLGDYVSFRHGFEPSIQRKLHLRCHCGASIPRQICVTVGNDDEEGLAVDDLMCFQS
jgi:hypothetical protein